MQIKYKRYNELNFGLTIFTYAFIKCNINFIYEY